MDAKTDCESSENSLFWKNGNGKAFSRLFPVLVLLGCFLVLLVLPFKIVSQGYLPSDDALRHAGFAVSGKALNEVMVSDGQLPDIHEGWHGFLRFMHRCGLESTEEVVVFEVILLALLFLLPPLFLVKRPEVWIIALLLAYNFFNFGYRLFFGRPFIVSMAVLVCLLLLRDRLNQPKFCWRTWLLLGLGMTVSIWWRMTWFLYLFPIAAFAAARQWRATGRLLILLAASTVLATLFCGDWMLPVEAIKGVVRALGSASDTTALVSELQPATTFIFPIIVVVLLMVSVKLRGARVSALLDSPVFYLLAGSCFLSSGGARWFDDFGIMALLVMMVQELEAWLERDELEWFNWFSFSRCAVGIAAVALFYASLTANQGGRWSDALKREYVLIDDPETQVGLPDGDGIIYSTSMAVFYQTFFKYPQAPWRYILGCEAAVMPADDLEIYRRIQWNHGAVELYQPWVEKMKPQDRMWLVLGLGETPKVEGLKWTKMTSRIWSGRVAAAGGTLPKIGDKEE